MIKLKELEKTKFKKFLRENWKDISRDIQEETSVSIKTVEKVLDSLHCYILFTYKDICPLSKNKKQQ